MDSDTVNCTRHSELVAFLFSAIVPMIEIVSAVLLISSFPFQKAFCLMLHHNAFLELGVVIFATISSVQRDLESIQFLLAMGLWLVDIVRLYQIHG